VAPPRGCGERAHASAPHPPPPNSLLPPLALVSGQAQQIFLVGFLASVAGGCWAWSEGVGGPAIAQRREQERERGRAKKKTGE
jgi:membrane protein YqaA with SNARE-associated domain